MAKPLSPVMLDESFHHDIEAVALLRTAVITQMSSFLKCKEIDRSVFASDDRLHIKGDETLGRYDFEYAGTHIRFTVITGLIGNEATAKVRCTHECEILGKSISHSLGEFDVSTNGRTNFYELSGKVYFTAEAADLIVASFIAKAMEHNLSIS